MLATFAQTTAAIAALFSITLTYQLARRGASIPFTLAVYSIGIIIAIALFTVH